MPLAKGAHTAPPNYTYSSADMGKLAPYRTCRHLHRVKSNICTEITGTCLRELFIVFKSSISVRFQLSGTNHLGATSSRAFRLSILRQMRSENVTPSN